MTIDPTPQTGPARQGSTERCTNPDCGHTKRDHSGRRDHNTKHPSIPLRPWCHACETDCLYEQPVAAVEPHADRAALRDRIAEALHGDQTPPPVVPWKDELPLDREYFLRRADAVLAVLPPPADRAAVLREAADAVFALDYDVMVGEVGDENFGSMREAWDVGTIHATELLRRLAAETQPDEPPCCSDPTCTCVQVNAEGLCECVKWDAGARQQADTETQAHPPSHAWKVESPRRENWASWGATHDERVWAAASYEDVIAVAPQRPFRLVRATTTYVVEAEHTPPAVPVQPAADDNSKEPRP